MNKTIIHLLKKIGPDLAWRKKNTVLSLAQIQSNAFYSVEEIMVMQATKPEKNIREGPRNICIRRYFLYTNVQNNAIGIRAHLWEAGFTIELNV